MRLKPPTWRLPREELARLFSRSHQVDPVQHADEPARQGLRRDELEFIAELLPRYDAYAVCDEVYEHLVFDGRQHHLRS